MSEQTLTSPERRRSRPEEEEEDREEARQPSPKAPPVPPEEKKEPAGETEPDRPGEAEANGEKEKVDAQRISELVGLTPDKARQTILEKSSERRVDTPEELDALEAALTAAKQDREETNKNQD